MNRLDIIFIGILVLIISCDQKHSEAFNRYKNSILEYERESQFFTRFKYSEVTGLGYFGEPYTDPVIQEKLEKYRKSDGPFYIKLNKNDPELGAAYYLRHNLEGFADSITFRDPTSPIKIGDTYHIWFSRTWGTPPVGQEKGTQTSYHDSKNKWKRIYSWDFVSIWHATSKDGYHWEEQDMALEPGPTGSYDDRCVFTPDILVANNKYYLYYQLAKSPHVFKDGPHHIAMAWSDSPNGPWHKTKEPVLYSTGVKGEFDALKVHDPCLIKKGGKYWLYFKGDGDYREPYQFGEYIDIGWGVAIADKPEGPFIRSELNPVICGGHEVMIFPYKKGVCAFVRQGPELFTVQYAEDALNFKVVSHLMSVPQLVTPEVIHNMPLSEITLAEAFKEQGYTTFFAGKWNLGETEEYWPENQRFDINKGGCNKGSPPGGFTIHLMKIYV
ncbi:family 43 glycosylhydrolase [Bacteroidota bacterium]